MSKLIGAKYHFRIVDESRLLTSIQMWKAFRKDSSIKWLARAGRLAPYKRVRRLLHNITLDQTGITGLFCAISPVTRLYIIYSFLPLRVERVPMFHLVVLMGTTRRMDFAFK